MKYPYNPYSKYGSKKTEYNGRMYDSKYEAEIAYELDMRMRAKEFTAIEPQFKIQLYTYDKELKQIPIFKYYCDFKCTKPDGTYLLVEAKGFRTDIYRAKHKILTQVWLKDNPEYEFVERMKDE